SLSDWTTLRSGGGMDGGEDGLENILGSAETLKDHLQAQLTIAALDPEKRLIGLSLIDGIDEAGYLRADLAEITERLGSSPEMVETILKIIQGFDPPGVGARDLAECLAIQLREKSRFDPAMEALLTR